MKSKIQVTRTLVGILLASAPLTAAVPAIVNTVRVWPSWREIAGAGATTDSPVALNAGSQVHVRGLDNRIYLNPLVDPNPPPP